MTEIRRRFGLIGHPVEHSWSARYFQEKWTAQGIDNCEYGLYDLASVGEIEALWQKPGWAGMNVTLPYKKSILPFLDGLSPEAEAIGAVNTVAFTPQGRIGHNTDAVGFKRSIAPFLEGHHQRALILGTGGSAAAVRHVLENIGLDVFHASRKPNGPKMVHYEDITAEGLKATPLVVNCTPVGMHPKVDHLPPLSEGALGAIGPDHLVIDLVYNPVRTRLLEQASLLGARTLGGLSMLKLQAEASWDIWEAEASHIERTTASPWPARGQHPQPSF